MTPKDHLLTAAQRRRREIVIEGMPYTVQELSAAAFAQFGQTVGTDRNLAQAILLADGIVDADGPMLTQDEALQVAKCARVATPLVNAIMAISGFGAAEKEPSAG